MEKTYKVVFDIKNLGLYGLIPGIKKRMQDELIQVYDVYANRTNAGVTDKLNDEFNRLNPDYFERNRDEEWYDLKEYNQFMAEGYQREVVDELNKANASTLLDFYVNPEEVNFMGRLKADHKVTIDFSLKEV